MRTTALTSRRLGNARQGRGRQLAAALAALFGAAQIAVAQNPPARLPAVVVNAAPDPPGPRKIAGVVRDTSGVPVGEVEVTIPQLQRRAITQLDGSFHFEDIGRGNYAVRARKLGYAPQIRTILVDASGGAGAFALVPLPQALAPVVVTVARGGLSGVVGDTAFKPLFGADVRVLGHGESVKTDSLGAFYFPLRPGKYIVTVTQPGFDYKMVSITVPDDSGRRVTVFLPPLKRAPIAREAHNLDDFETRLEHRSEMRSRVYTQADLKRMNIEWAYDAVNIAFGALCHGRMCRTDNNCSAVVNGGPATIDIGTLTVDQIETMEVYVGAQDPGSSRGQIGADIVKGSSHGSLPLVPLTNRTLALSENWGKNCVTTYVWLR
ncbi:MAG: carboxypeptidase regulatory-like domain-containing protein [bacterium]